MPDTTEPDPPRAGEGEQTVQIRTFLIADVRGYTLFTQERGDEAAAKLAAKCADIVREVVEARGGNLLELRGDEALCVFSSAREAIRTAVDVQQRFVEETLEQPELPLTGGYLPSLSDASSAGPAGAIASDSISLARWWRAFCGGELVSEASLTEMSTFVDGYGLGLYNPADPYAVAVGHTGGNFGYVSWAGCLPDEGAVVVVLSDVEFDDIGGMARPLVEAVIAD